MHSILDAVLGPLYSSQPIPPSMESIKVLDGRGIEAGLAQILVCFEAGVSIDDICEQLYATLICYCHSRGDLNLIVKSPLGQYLIADGYEFSTMPPDLHTQPLHRIM